MLARWLVLRRAAFRTSARFPRRSDGVVQGAETISHAGGKRGVLLLHGFGDTPQTLAPIAARLMADGWTVRAPLLAGHGRSLESFVRSKGSDWEATAREAWDELARGCDRVAIVGLSMGGALACTLAGSAEAGGATRTGHAGEAEHPGTGGGATADGVGEADGGGKGDRAATTHDAGTAGGDRTGRVRPAALVLLTPYLVLPRVARLGTTLWPLWQLWRPWVVGDGEASIFDPAARSASLGYGRATPRLLRELRGVVERGRRAAAHVRAPTLAIFSTQDYRIPREAAQAIFNTLTAPVRELQWVERSGHVITVDFDGALVAARVAGWLDRHVPSHHATDGSVGAPERAGEPPSGVSRSG